MSITSMQPRIEDMEALPSRSHYPLKIKNQQTPSEAIANFERQPIGVQIKLVFHFQTMEIGQILALKSECAKKSTVNNCEK